MGNTCQEMLQRFASYHTHTHRFMEPRTIQPAVRWYNFDPFPYTHTPTGGHRGLRVALLLPSWATMGRRTKKQDQKQTRKKLKHKHKHGHTHKQKQTDKQKRTDRQRHRDTETQTHARTHARARTHTRTRTRTRKRTRARERPHTPIAWDNNRCVAEVRHHLQQNTMTDPLKLWTL